MQKNHYYLIYFLITGISLALVWSAQSFFSPIFVKNHALISGAEAQTVDKTPPAISNVSVDELTSSSTVITWTTDKEADSMVNYNVKPDYGTIRDPALTTKHKLVIPELLSSQLYFYRLISSDENGNQSISHDYSFTTKDTDPKTVSIPETEKKTEPTPPSNGENNGPGKGAGDGSGEKQSELIQQTISMLEQINTEEGLEMIDSKIQNLAQEKAAPPVISGDFAKVDVTTETATIRWKTDKESNSVVALAAEGEYNPNAANPYRWKEGEPDQMTLAHEVLVRGLKPATTYHFQVLSKSSLGLEGISGDSTFRTKSIMPEIFNLNVSKVEEDSATINLTTNVPCSAIIEYTDLATNEVKLEGSPTLVTEHVIRLKDLKFDTYYSAIVKVENEQGEKTVSEPVTFTTVRDKVPPTIAKVNTDSTLYPGTDNKTQTIISWQTDEQSICQLMYFQGLATSDKDASSLPEETDYTVNHVQVVTAFQPATVYKFWIQCHDKTLNKSRSDDFTMLTPAKEQSILDMIIKNFEGTFGWLKKK